MTELPVARVDAPKNYKNPYLPHLATINGLIQLTKDVKLFELRINEAAIRDNFDFDPGQFVMLSIFGIGEAPFSITSAPSKKGFLQLAIRKAGKLTEYLHRMDVGTTIGIRGPYGRGFPYKDMQKSDVLLVAGGLGLAPLNSLIGYIHDNRAAYGRITILYGAKNPGEILFKDLLQYWQNRKDIALKVTVDEPTKNWKGEVGLITKILETSELDPDNAFAAVCGPPVMFKFVVKELLRRNMPKGRIFVSLERKMHCGVGKCSHCGVGYKFTCIHGPVFSYWEIMNLQEAI